MSENTDTNGDGNLSGNEMSACKDIYFVGCEISSLMGIEHFTELTKLSCDINNMCSLDISKNLALTELYCDNNKLSSLDLSKNMALHSSGCSSK